MSPSSGIVVRVAGPSDAPGLLPMFRTFYGKYLEVADAEDIGSRLVAAASVDTVLVALFQGQLAGFASLRVIPQIESARPHAELSDIFVDERFRRRGVGRALMSHAEGLARERGCARIHLTTDRWNDGARAFYRALGYSEFGVTLNRELQEHA